MKKIILALLCSLPCAAQVPVAPITQPHVTFVNASGAPCAGCTLGTFVAGTTTPLATYIDSGGVSMNQNPIVLDAAGGANIWLGNNAYKFILKTPSGTTIWTVDQVKGGGGLGGICGPAGTIQTANSAVNGLTCDPSITINTTQHTLNVGTLPAHYVTIGALSTPTSWTFDTTTPATALASLGGGSTAAGGANQLAFYPAAGTAIAGTSSIPSGIVATTQSPGDNSTKLATTAYVNLPGPIAPSSLAIAAGTAVTGNQGTGLLLQHSTGSTTANNCAKFDATGNTVDAGISCAAVVSRTCNSNGCYRVEGDGTIEQWGVLFCGSASCTVTFPTTFTTTTNLSFTATVNYSAGNLTTVSSSVGITTAILTSNGVVNVGGSGASYSGGGTYHWRAIGQ